MKNSQTIVMGFDINTIYICVTFTVVRLDGKYIFVIKKPIIKICLKYNKHKGYYIFSKNKNTNNNNINNNFEKKQQGI